MRDEQVVIPSGLTVVEPGDRIVLFAQRSVLPKLEKFLELSFSVF